MKSMRIPKTVRSPKDGFRQEEHDDNVQHCQNAVGDGRLRSGLGRCETRRQRIGMCIEGPSECEATFGSGG